MHKGIDSINSELVLISKALTLACFVLFNFSGLLRAQNYEGTEFHFAFIDNLDPLFNTPPTFDVSIQAVEDATVTVEFGAVGDPYYLTQSLFVPAGASGLITFPTGILYQENYFVTDRRTFLATSTGLVRLYAFHNRLFFSEATAILPSDALGTVYRPLALPAQNFINENSSICKIVAVEDDTVVEVTTAVATPLGPAGIPVSVTLNAREAISIAVPAPLDITGTLISSSPGKPVAVFAGNDVIEVGQVNCQATSHAYEQMTPVSSWGAIHPIIPTPEAGGDYARILAASDGTELYNGCDLIATINEGQTYDAYFDEAFVLYSSAPVMVGMFTVGYQCSNLVAGDPNMRILLPFDKAMQEVRLLSSYILNETFLGIPQNSFWFLNVAMPTDQTDQLLVNGVLVTNWQPFPSLPEMSYASVPIPDVAVQELVAESSQPFWCDLVGLGPADAKTMSLGTTTTMEIPEQNELVVDLGPDFDICPGEEVLLDTGLGVAGTWQDGSVQETFLVTEPGVYSVDVPGACNSTGAEVVVGLSDGPFLDLPQSYDFCEGQTVEIGVEASPGVTYTWSSGQTTSSITVSETGMYELTASAGEGCESMAETLVETIDPPTVILEAPDALCNGGAGQIDAQTDEAGSFLWSDGSTASNIDINMAGTYSVTFTSTEGCEAEASITVLNLSGPALDILAPPAICPGETAELIALFESGTLTWDDGSNNTERIISTPGSYQATLVDDGGCTSTEVVVVGTQSLPVITVSDASVCEGVAVQLVASAQGAQVTWQGALPGNILQVEVPGAYSVEATNECGTRSATATVEVRDCSCEVYVPNAFTPDGDGINELFIPVIGCDPINYELRIFDRWGREVFKSNDPNEAWNGASPGITHYAEAGIFQWVMRYANPNLPVPETELLRGTVLVVR